jgi:hypothetical protein
MNRKKYFFIFSIFFLISFIFFQSTFWYQDGLFFIKSKLWSDFAAHIPLIRSFSLGNNFLPEYPFFAGEKISYHFLFYLLVAGFEKIGFQIDFALNFVSAFGSALLLTTIVGLGQYFFSFSAGLLAVILFLFNGSLSFMEFFIENPVISFSDGIEKIIAQKHFISFGPWDGGVISAFWNLNIFTNQRHLAMGLGVLFFLIYVFENKFKNKKIIFSKKEIFFLSLSIILLPLLHQASFAFLAIYLLVGFLEKRKKFSKQAFIFLSIIGIISSAIYLFWGSSFTPIFQLGFLAKEKTFLSMLNYWFNNFGLYLFFIPLLLFLSFRKKDKFKKFKTLYLSGFLVFVLAHLFKFSPDMINNHKFVTIFLVILNIGVAGLLEGVFSKKGLIKKIGATIVLFFLTFSGVIDLFPILNDSLVVKKDYQQTEFGRWVVESPKDSVFLVNSYLYNPASLAGRKLYLDYGYFAWSMGYPDRERRQSQKLIFAEGISRDDWCSLMADEGIDYLTLSRGEKKFLEEYGFEKAAFTKFAVPDVFDEVSDVSSNLVYNVREICQ